MLLALDIGNTNITVGVFDGDTLRLTTRLAADRARMADQYAVELRALLRLHGVEPAAITGAILSSVVPPLDSTLAAAVQSAAGVTALRVAPGIKTGLNIRIDNPAQLGADMLVGAVAAVATYGTPCLVWDLGTATKAYVVDKNGLFRGGIIAPGVAVSLDALVARAALLPGVALHAPAGVIGANTEAAMQAGIVLGTAAMMDGLTARIEEELGYPVTAVVTGGLSGDIVAHCRHTMIYHDTLTLDGLRLLYEKNNNG